MFARALPPGIDFKFKALKFKRVATSNHLPNIMYTQISLEFPFHEKPLTLNGAKKERNFQICFFLINAERCLFFKVYSLLKHKQISCCLVCVNSAR